MAAKQKRKQCEKAHVSDVNTWPFTEFISIQHDGVPYINPFSVYKMLNMAGLTDHANIFMRAVSSQTLQKLYKEIRQRDDS